MAVPKKKTSKSRTRSRRAASWRVRPMSRSTCYRCGTVKRPHHACKNCGYYRNRQVLEVT